MEKIRSVDQAPGKGKKDDVKKSTVREFISFMNTLFIIIGAALLLRGTVVEAFKIPSASMKPTLLIGDHIFVWKLSYGFRLPGIQKSLYLFKTPSRGDIVVFTRPDDPSTSDDESRTNIIKRVLGLPGEQLEVRGTRVYINNQPLEEPYARWAEGGLPEGNFGPMTVPEDKILLLGDNRDHSKDSRFWNDPFLPLENVKGRAFIIYWSWDSPSRIGTLVR
jgi:signal peptidase I